jgi:hypothetical protein
MGWFSKKQDEVHEDESEAQVDIQHHCHQLVLHGISMHRILSMDLTAILSELSIESVFIPVMLNGYGFVDTFSGHSDSKEVITINNPSVETVQAILALTSAADIMYNVHLSYTGESLEKYFFAIPDEAPWARKARHFVEYIYDNELEEYKLKMSNMYVYEVENYAVIDRGEGLGNDYLSFLDSDGDENRWPGVHTGFIISDKKVSNLKMIFTTEGKINPFEEDEEEEEF